MTNPFIEPENYWDGYQKSIDELKNKPEALDFPRLCFMTFQTEHGKKLLEYIDENILMANLTPITTPNYEVSSTYYEGFKEAFRMLKMSIRSHKDYIENNKG